MTSESLRKNFVRWSLALALWATPCSVAPTQAGTSPSMVLGAPAYHAVSDQLRIPVKGGGAPKFLIQQLAARQFVVDFAACDVPEARHSIAQPDESQLAGWSIAKAPHQGHARLRLTVREQVPPRVHFDAVAREVVFNFGSPTSSASQAGEPSTFRRAELTGRAQAHQRILTRRVSEMPLVLRQAVDPAPRSRRPLAPQRKAAPRRPNVIALRRVSRPTKTPTRNLLGVPHFDAANQQLVIPVVRGHIPPTAIRTYRLNRRWSYLDIEGALPTFGGVRYQERADFKFQRWVSARRPQRAALRVSFASGVPVRLDVRTTPRAVLVRVVPTHAVKIARAKTRVTRHVLQRRTIRQPAARLALGRTARPLKPHPISKPETTLSRPYYDEERFGLVLPYEGRVPLFRYVSKSARNVVLEFKAAVRHDSHLQHDRVVSENWGEWRLARSTRGAFLHLEMNFNRASDLSIAADPSRQHLVLIPQPRPAKRLAATSGTEPSFLFPVLLDQREENLFIPFSGAVPRYVLERVSPTYVYLVFSAATLREAGVQLRTSTIGTPLRYALISQPESSKSVRLAVSLAVPAGVKVYQDIPHSRLIVALDRHAQQPAPSDTNEPQMPLPWTEDATRKLPTERAAERA